MFACVLSYDVECRYEHLCVWVCVMPCRIAGSVMLRCGSRGTVGVNESTGEGNIPSVVRLHGHVGIHTYTRACLQIASPSLEVCGSLCDSCLVFLLLLWLNMFNCFSFRVSGTLLLFAMIVQQSVHMLYCYCFDSSPGIPV
jgi:hypothetical protein